MIVVYLLFLQIYFSDVGLVRDSSNASDITLKEMGRIHLTQTTTKHRVVHVMLGPLHAFYKKQTISNFNAKCIYPLSIYIFGGKSLIYSHDKRIFVIHESLLM